MPAKLLKPIGRVLLRVLFRVRVVGRLAPIQLDGRVAERLLIIANHESFLDGVILALFLPADPVFVVHTYVAENRWFRLGLRLVDYLTLDPTSPLAMRQVVRLLESGRPVLVFPEGRITTTGSLMKVYDGPAFAAVKTGAAIVPVRLDGTGRSYFGRVAGRHPRRLLPRITVTILPATRLSPSTAASPRHRRRAAGEGMRRIMQAMIFASETKQTLYTGLLDALRVQGRRRLVAEDVRGIEYSYGRLLMETLLLGRVAARLCEPGEGIGLLLPNLVATVTLVIGLGVFRRVPAMLNYTAGPEGLKHACRVARIRTVITSRAFVETARLKATVAALDPMRVCYLEDLIALARPLDKLWLLGYALWLPRTLGRDVAPEDPAVVLFTSGSEAKPKGVVLSHRALLSNIAQVRAVIDFGAEDKIFNALPVFHSFGLTIGALLPLVTGTRIFIYPSPLHYRVIPELVYDRGCTVLLGTPTFLQNYARFAHPYDFHRLRYVIAGAERLAEPVRVAWFERFGIRVLEGYGATETAPVLAINTPMAYRGGTVGQLLPGIEARIEPIPGIEHGGELHVRGPNLMSGYYRDAAPGVLDPPCSGLGSGWYDTGDIVELDEEGFVKITGRLKRFAKIAGEMVSLEVVEHIAALASPGAQHAASVKTDARRGELIVLFSTDADLTRERLQDGAREIGEPEIAIPRQIVHVAALPLLGSGKLDHVALRRMAEEGAG
ncbi:MAG: bifunctional acyl-ACP--phospholipid O-acyltransferase/long-chain-fatty-acid--ACP ligase [Gammaproteobacteria bacterium]|nr:bifunctional acyl-ACP--phospholipid O-acyltransferase/long-chain-fatty-acid--ACP ligase [Gammaproteobacteria bacterium]